MQVSAQFALSHFDEISSAIDRGEEVEILRPGKPTLRLVPDPVPSQTRIGKRVLGAGIGELRVPSDREWRQMDQEIESEMCDAPLISSGDV